MTTFDLYFSTNRTPVFEGPNVEVYNRSTDEMVIYRRGVRVFKKAKSIYDYDMKAISIGEDRTSTLWDINWTMVNFWKAYATPEMIVSLYGSPESHEFNLDWSYGTKTINDNWWLTLQGKVIIPKEFAGYFADDLSEFNIKLPFKLCLELHKKFGSQLNIRGLMDNGSVINETPATDKERGYIKRALDFLMRSEHFSDIDPDIIRVAVMENNTLGTVNNGLIYLSPEVFKKGLKTVVAVIIEEWLHIKTKASDRTRFFQNALIELTISVLEDQLGVYL